MLDGNGSSYASCLAALPVAPRLHTLPEACKLHILRYASARCVLRLEATSRAIDFRQHARVRTAYDTIWRRQLHARWPREAPALCSLVGPQATPRQLYMAFATRKIARTNITRDAQHEDALHRIAFILCVGGCARAARFAEGSNGEQPDVYDTFGMRHTDSDLGRINPGPSCVGSWEFRGGEQQFNFGSTFPPRLQDHGPLNNWNSVRVKERTGNQLSQSFYVIDLQSLKCVTLFENIYPKTIGNSGPRCLRLAHMINDYQLPVFFRHDHPVEYHRRDNRPERGAYVDVMALCEVEFELERVEPGNNNIGPFVYRLAKTDVYFSGGSGFAAGDTAFCPYLLGIIQQTHGATAL